MATSFITVDDVTVGESETYADFVVRLDVPNTGVVTVNYTTFNGTAYYNGSDYNGQSGYLTFAPGETVKTVRVTLIHDTQVESAENFGLELSSPSANATIGRNVATATIIDNDATAGTPIVSINDFVVDEAAKEATFVITLNKPNTSVVSLNYATQNGTALGGSDFVATSGSLSFAPGETAKTIKVTLLNDTVAESSEAFNLVLSNLTNGTVLDAVGTAVINENDAPAVTKSNLTVDDVTVGESETYADFVVRLDVPNTGVVTVNYTTLNGTAYYDGYDYNGRSGYLTFAPGETVKTVRVTLINDTEVEPAENFGLELSSPSANATIGRNVATATIIDNDATSGTPIVSINDFVVDEAAKEATFVITLNKPNTSVVSLNYATQNGTALGGSDFVATSGSLSFAPGETAKTIKVTLLNDTVAESSEAFNLVLSNLINATVLNAAGTAVINENDAPAVTKSNLTVDDVTVGESETYADFVVRLDVPNTGVVTVNYTTLNGTAYYDGYDYNGRSGYLTFAPGETVKTVRVTLIHDTQVESAENFGLELSSPSANATIGRNVATATIIDNDATAGTPIVSINDFVVDEAAKEATFVITLNKPNTSVVSLNYATQNGTALGGSDFVATSGNLSFAPGETAKTVKVTLLNDTVAESSEAFNLVLSNLTNGTVLNAAGTAVINENDAPAVAKSNLTVDDVTVGESETYADFVVRLDVPNTGVVTVNYTTFNGTAYYNGYDYNGQSGYLTFAPGETVKTVRVTLIHDTQVESAENFGLELSSPSANATIGRNVATATIIDNDATAGTPIVSINDFVVDEAAKEATFVITLNKPNTSVVSLNYATQNGTALGGSDFVATSGSLSFAPGETAKTIKVTLLNDTVAESSEAFNLVLSNLTNGTVLDAVGTAVINENDAPAVTKSNLTVDDVTVGESETYADFVVRLDVPNTGVVTVNYTTLNGTAYYDGYDYNGRSGYLTFAPGETVKTVRVTLINDTEVEPAENFGLELSSPSANATIGRNVATATIIDNDATSGTPIVSINDFVVDEAAKEATFVITLNKPNTSVVSLNYATQNGTALGGSDFVATSGSLSFAPGETAKTIKVTLLNDTVAESSEAFNLVLSNLTNGTVLDAVGTAVINENDAPAVTKSNLTVDDVTVGESETYADFVVRLDVPNTGVVTVNYTTLNGTAYYDGYDYNGRSGYLTFAPGETVKTVRVTLIHDTQVESAENFGLELSSPSANATIGRNVATATIIDNDATAGTPIVSINDFVVDEAAKEATFVITLNKPNTSVVSLNYATQNGTALGGSDFVATSGSLSFAPGETAKTIKVTLLNDTVAESSEAFNLVLSNLTNGTVLDAVGTAVINENDAPAVTKSNLTVDDVTVGESETYADFVVRLDVPNTGVVTVNYTTLNGTAYYDGYDYNGRSGYLTFAPGETVKTVRVTLINDTEVEPAENFGLELSSPSANATIGRNVATATIIDNDATAGTPIVSINDFVVDEAAKEATFVITLNKPNTSVVSLNYATQNGTALGGSDFVATSGSLSFAPGETAKTIKVTLLNDTVAESSEAFNLVLSNLTNGTVLDAVGTAVINENDAPAVTKSNLTVDDVTVGESETYADFVVRLDVPNTGVVTVNYTTLNGTAYYDGYDYNGRSGYLTFAPGETVKTVRVTLINDTEVEPAENFGLELSSPSANATIGRNVATATIIDNDATSGTPIVSINDFVVDEAAKEATFVITLNKPNTSVVSLNYATQNGTALGGSDFVATSGSLSFAPGETAKTVKVTLLNDTVAESSEAFNLVLSNLTNGTVLDAVGTAVINENDAPAVTKSNLTVDDVTVGESETYADFVVRLDVPNTGVVTVNYTTLNGTAYYDGYDYNGRSGYLTFAPGETVKTVRVTLINDTEVEPAENFGLELSSPSANATIGRNVATATIIDNDATSGTPIVSINDFVVDEAAKEATFVITLNKPNTSVVSLNYATQNGTALGGSDFVATSGNLSFAPGETAKTIKVTLLNDTVAESSEAFNLVLSNLTNGTVLDAVGTAVINENDAPAVTKSNLTVDDVTVGESETYADFVVRLDVPNTGVVTVNYTTLNGTAYYDGYDYNGRSGYLTFAPGETVKTVRVTLINDTEVEPAENFGLQLSSPSANATIGRNVATATIIDNDATTGTPVVSLGDAVVDENNGLAYVTFTLGKPSTGDVKVNYSIKNVTATSGTDFVSFPNQTVSFQAGETAKTIVVGVLDDTISELSEFFDVAVTSVSGATIGDGRGHVIIGSNDATAVATSTISVANVAAVESDGYADFLVRLDAPNTGVVTVNYTTFNGTAYYSGYDYNGQSGFLTFAAGETVKTVRVTLVNDTTAESSENFGLQLSSPSTNAVLGNTTATATIIDNDSAPPVALINITGTTGSDILRGTPFADSLVGGAGNDVLDGAGGNDSMNGGSGNDLYIIEQTGDTIAEAVNGGNDKVVSYLNYTLTANVEDLLLAGSALTGTGNSLNNAIAGNASSNTLDGGTGADTLIGGAGNDIYVVDNAGDVVTELANGGTDTVQSSINYILPTEVENLTLTGSAAINGTGNSLANTISGNVGNNVLDGSTGSDTVSYSNATAAVTVNLAIASAQNTVGAGTDTLLNFENLTGSNFADTLTGNAGANILNGGTGNDLLQGGTGNDTYIIDSVSDVISETSTVATEIDTVQTSISYTLGTNLENLILTGTAVINGTGNSLNNIITGNSGNNTLDGGSGNDTLSGGSGNDTIRGGIGNDSIDGGAGNDSLVGGTGNDIYVVDSIGDVVIENVNEGTDTIQSSVSYTLGVNLENLTLTGTGAINGIGNSLNNAITGNSGNNTLNGAAGNDILIGNTGNDIYVVDSTGDVVIENVNEGTDTIQSSVSYTLGVNLENLTLTGTGAINGIGNSLNNAITGNSGNNTLNGAAGNDILIGSTGNDALLGGDGNDTLNGAGSENGTGFRDTLTGGNNNDLYILGNSSAVFYNDGNSANAGLNDYARVTDFNTSQDKIQLKGLASSYFLGSSPIVGISGTAIYLDTNANSALNSTDELVAIVEGVSGLNLTAGYFSYVA